MPRPSVIGNEDLIGIKKTFSIPETDSDHAQQRLVREEEHSGHDCQSNEPRRMTSTNGDRFARWHAGDFLPTGPLTSRGYRRDKTGTQCDAGDEGDDPASAEPDNIA